LYFFFVFKKSVGMVKTLGRRFAPTRQVATGSLSIIWFVLILPPITNRFHLRQEKGLKGK